MVNHVESDRSTDLVWRERGGALSEQYVQK